MEKTYDVKLATWVRIDTDNEDEAGEKALQEFRENPDLYPVEVERIRRE